MSLTKQTGLYHASFGCCRLALRAKNEPYNYYSTVSCASLCLFPWTLHLVLLGVFECETFAEGASLWFGSRKEVMAA